MIYTTDLFRLDCSELAKQVGSFQFTHILYVERGGKYVADEMIKYIQRKVYASGIRVSFYNGKERNSVPLVHYPSCKVFKDTDNVLVVDDLCDGGHTMQYITKMYILKKCRFKTAVLIKKPSSVIDPDFCVRRDVTSWVQFPWEDSNGNHINDLGVSHTPSMAACGA